MKTWGTFCLCWPLEGWWTSRGFSTMSVVGFEPTGFWPQPLPLAMSNYAAVWKEEAVDRWWQKEVIQQKGRPWVRGLFVGSKRGALAEGQPCPSPPFHYVTSFPKCTGIYGTENQGLCFHVGTRAQVGRKAVWGGVRKRKEEKGHSWQMGKEMAICHWNNN